MLNYILTISTNNLFILFTSFGSLFADKEYGPPLVSILSLLLYYSILYLLLVNSGIDSHWQLGTLGTVVSIETLLP